MSLLVLEIGTEEIPARFLSDLQAGLKAGCTAAFDKALLECTSIETFATPRRLVLRVDGLSPLQRTAEDVVTGPPRRVAYDAAGQPTKAALGFARTNGVTLDDAFILETDKGEYLAVRRVTGGAAAADILPGILPGIIGALPFPKRMRWGSLDFAFGRPVRWILAMLDDAVLPFPLAGISSGNLTWGHRVMGPGPFVVTDAEQYFTLIAAQGRVVLDATARRSGIVAQGDVLASQAAAGAKPVWKPALLDEVSGLVEAPTVMLGSFNPSFLELPREVLLTSMESHQKSFGVETADGRLLPHFLCTLNLEPKDPALVRKGWERVLKARLEDARFFWKTDTAQGLDAWLEKLDHVVFLGPLGSMGDKSRRLETLCGYLTTAYGSADPALAEELRRAGRLAKADLVSEMVGEFADLQGLMGGIYARRAGESERVSRAIYEHYLPTGPDSPVPVTLAGGLLSIADKADTLAGCFGLNMIPTGANDPYGLRRAVLGICRIILEKGLRLDLEALLRTALQGYGQRSWKLAPEQALPRLLEFFSTRLKHYFIGQGCDTLVVEAAVGAGVNDIFGLAGRLQALEAFSKEPDFAQAVLTFKRAGNIIRKQGQDDGSGPDGRYRPELLVESQEKALAAKLESVTGPFQQLWSEDNYAELFGLLRALRPFVDAFFDNVMVMCDDAALRRNRLDLLAALTGLLGRLADFNALQV